MAEIFDGHNDTVHRLQEYHPGGIDFLAGSPDGHLDLPRARQGGLIGGLFALFVRPRRAGANGEKTQRSAPPAGAALNGDYARRTTRELLKALRRLESRSNGGIRIAASVDEIENARRAGSFVIVLHMEGAEAIGPDLLELETLYAAGLRSLGPVWSRPNVFGHGVPFAYPRSPDTGPGLTPAGVGLVRACNRLGIMIDVSHLNEKGFWDVARLSSAPLVATHSCVHAICPSSRNLTDAQLDAIRDSHGLVGVNFSVRDVRPDGRKDDETPLDLLTRHFVYLADRIGIDGIAIGSDFDGATIPKAIKDASGLPRLIDALRTCGFDEASLRKIAFENWMRVFRLSWRQGSKS